MRAGETGQVGGLLWALSSLGLNPLELFEDLMRSLALAESVPKIRTSYSSMQAHMQWFEQTCADLAYARGSSSRSSSRRRRRLVVALFVAEEAYPRAPPVPRQSASSIVLTTVSLLVKLFSDSSLRYKLILKTLFGPQLHIQSNALLLKDKQA